MRNLLSILSFLLFSISLLAQNFSGIIIDGKTQRGLAYVNIGVLGKNTGTVSAPDGSFAITLPNHLDDSRLKISMVGYESLEFSVSEFKKKLSDNRVVVLQPISIELQEVVVIPPYNTTAVLGNTTTSTNTTGGFDVDTLGREAGIAVRLKRKYRPAQVLKFTASIARNEYDTIRFRLNFYELKGGQPRNKIVQENIILTSTIEQGLLEVDLTPYNILVKDDFCVTLEWIEDFGKKELDFSLQFFGSKLIYRSTSQDSWRDFRLLSPGFNVTIGYRD